MLPNMALCSPRCSCVVHSGVEDVWRLVRQWSLQPWLSQVDGQPVLVQTVEGIDHAVGSVRAVNIGHARMFERLVAVDEDAHSLKWRLISHPGNISPFPAASYVNFSSTLVLKEVTHTRATYVEWKGEFYTEHSFAKEMLATFLRWFETGLRELQVLSAGGGIQPFAVAPTVPQAGLQRPNLAQFARQSVGSAGNLSSYAAPGVGLGGGAGAGLGGGLAGGLPPLRRPVGSVPLQPSSPIGSVNLLPELGSLSLSGEPGLPPSLVKPQPPLPPRSSQHQQQQWL